MDIFRFKQFSIRQDKCAMKVGTDGVLLGAWADGAGAKSMLDIGTGTGLIALMMAQRFPQADIHAIEIDADAYEQALQNTAAANRGNVQVFHSALKAWMRFTDHHYDLIICNPPYYEKGFHVPDEKRKKARDAAHLSLNELIEAFKKLRSLSGKLNLVLPADIAQRFIDSCRDAGFFCSRQTMVFSKPGRPPKRVLLELVGFECPTVFSELLIEHDGQHAYTDDYRALTGAFYLNF